MGSWGTRMRRASGRRTRTRANAASRTASSGGQVEPATSVGAPRPNRRSGSSGGTAATRAATLSKRGSPRTRIRVRRDPQLRQALGVRLRDRSGRRDGARSRPGAARRAGQRSRPLPALTVAATSATVAPVEAARVASSGQRSSFEKTSRSGASAPRSRSAASGRSYGQVVGRVHGEAAGERLGGRTEVGVHELAPRHEPAELEQHALGLQALAHAGGVEPRERPRGVPRAGGPRRQPRGGATPLAVAVAHLPVHEPEGGGQRHADPDGGAIPPGGRRHRGNVAAARTGVNPAVRRTGRAGLAIERGHVLQFFHEVHVPPATEEVIHCLQSQGSPAAAEQHCTIKTRATLGTWGGRSERPLFCS